MKQIGRTRPRKSADETKQEEFALPYLNGDEEEATFIGVLAPRLSGTDLRVISMMSGTGRVAVSAEARTNRDVEALNAILSMLRRMMCNTDGLVRAGWKPVELPVPADLDEEERREFKPCYRGPDGQIYEFADDEAARKWDDPANWTTRRRWNALMDDDDDATVETDDLIELWEFGVTVASERPTQPQD